VLVEAGSKYETKDINGLSHFLEHMCFKGTMKRPTAMHIAGELDGIGAEYNAFTSQEWTGYFVKVQAHKAEQALDIISDLYLNPVFDSAEIEKEKGVIIEEINMYEDLPPRRVQEIFTQLMYGDQPAGWDIGGRKEVIRAMTKEHFFEISRSTLCRAGNRDCGCG
jgi:Predicted Zn-dependent peptidases